MLLAKVPFAVFLEGYSVALPCPACYGHAFCRPRILAVPSVCVA